MALPILDGNQSAATLSTIIAGGAHIPAHTVVSLGSQAISDITSGVSGSVVSISNFPASQGTTFGAVTGSVSVLNFPASQAVTFTQASVTFGVTTGSVSVLNFPSTQTVAGTVTANLNDPTNALISGQIGDALFGSDTLVNALNSNLILQNNVPVSGAVTANTGINIGGALPSGINAGIVPVVILDDEGYSVGDSGRSLKTSVVNTVSVGALPSGALTTRFGSVTTANTAQITSAVTNTSRKYLLAQNISAGTVTIGIGFSPTTTQGIQLPAGGGLTFDSFCPTGAVYWLGAVTGANYCLIEG